jgi:chromosomal replication initiator protein
VLNLILWGDGRMNVSILWSKLLDQVKSELTSLSYRTWFSDTELYKLNNGKAYIIVPMPIHKKHLQDNYYDIIVSKLAEISGSNYDLVFLLKEEIEDEIKKQEKKEEKINIENNDNVNSNLNKKYVFDNFIVGNSNKFAHAAALSVAENPGNMYNPLFLYGNSGLGKTHLMHAIGNYIVENSNKKVLYVTSEQFRQDFVRANRKDDKGTNFNYIDFFKNKYRNIDVLIIDDIQFLGGAAQSQQEFFHTFNNLYNDSKQIIISSDRSPDDLKLLEDRLRTRFCWGLTVNIFPPEFSLRTEILKKKIIAGNFEQDIPDDVIEYIASNIGPDVRQLEGSVTRLVAYSAIMGGEKITLDLAIEALKDFICKGIGEKNDVHRIQKIVSEHFQISVEDIRSKKRNANISNPRQIAMYLCRVMTSESFPKIGIEFGGKDHSTVMHSVEKIEKEIKENKDLANTIEKLKKDIGLV